MFYEKFEIRSSGVRILIAESAPIIDAPFVSQRLARELRARMDSRGIFQPALTTPRFSQIGGDLVLPMELDLSIFSELLHSDATIPFVFVKLAISSLTFDSDAHQLAHVVEFLQQLGKSGGEYTQLRSKIKLQAGRANVGASRSATEREAATRLVGLAHDTLRRPRDVATSATLPPPLRPEGVVSVSEIGVEGKCTFYC